MSIKEVKVFEQAWVDNGFIGIFKCPECGYDFYQKDSECLVISAPEDADDSKIKIDDTSQCHKCRTRFYSRITTKLYKVDIIEKAEDDDKEN